MKTDFIFLAPSRDETNALSFCCGSSLPPHSCADKHLVFRFLLKMFVGVVTQPEVSNFEVATLIDETGQL